MSDMLYLPDVSQESVSDDKETLIEQALRKLKDDGINLSDLTSLLDKSSSEKFDWSSLDWIKPKNAPK
jgi:hypothetical protein